MKRLFIAATIALLAMPALAQDKQREAQVGLLKCSVEGGAGFIIGSRKSMLCVFERSDGLPNENYMGRITKFGIDIGATAASTIAWAVFAPSNAVETTGRLAGTYGGLTGEATFGVGLGANALLGGFDKSVALQPLSLQGQTGLNIAAGVASLTLSAPSN